MVSKSEIILQFLDEVRSATAQWIDEDMVRPTNSDANEVYPSIDYRFDSRIKRYGQGSKPQPSGYIEDSDGNRIAALYRRYIRLRFDLKINTQDIALLLKIGEALDDAFAPYELWGEQAEDFHPHCHEFWINGANSADDPQAEPIARDDILDIEVEFYKHVRRDGTPIRKIYKNVTYKELVGNDEYTEKAIVTK